jgi:hypothetical protein
MIYRGSSFPAVVWFGSSLIPFPLLSRQHVVSLSQSSCVSPVGHIDGTGGGNGAKSYDRREKAWAAINHSIPSGICNVCIYIDITALTYLRDTGIEIVNTKYVLQIIHTDTWMWKLGLRPPQFLFWKYINRIFFAVCNLLSMNLKVFFFFVSERCSPQPVPAQMLREGPAGEGRRLDCRWDRILDQKDQQK